jgi:hypothetical protein
VGVSPKQVRQAKGRIFTGGYVNYSQLTEGASCFIEKSCPLRTNSTGIALLSTGSSGGPHPANFQTPLPTLPYGRGLPGGGVKEEMLKLAPYFEDSSEILLELIGGLQQLTNFNQKCIILSKLWSGNF